jgi:hypothetical protein
MERLNETEPREPDEALFRLDFSEPAARPGPFRQRR